MFYFNLGVCVSVVAAVSARRGRSEIDATVYGALDSRNASVSGAIVAAGLPCRLENGGVKPPLRDRDLGMTDSLNLLLTTARRVRILRPACELSCL